MNNKKKVILGIFLVIFIPEFAYACVDRIDHYLLNLIEKILLVLLPVFILFCLWKKKVMFNWLFVLTVTMLIAGVLQYAKIEYNKTKSNRETEECNRKCEEGTGTCFCNPLCG